MKLLPPPLHTVTASEEDEDVEVVELTDIDPVSSFKDNLPEEVRERERPGAGVGGLLVSFVGRESCRLQSLAPVDRVACATVFSTSLHVALCAAIPLLPLLLSVSSCIRHRFTRSRALVRLRARSRGSFRSMLHALSLSAPPEVCLLRPKLSSERLLLPAASSCRLFPTALSDHRALACARLLCGVASQTPRRRSFFALCMRRLAKPSPFTSYFCRLAAHPLAVVLAADARRRRRSWRRRRRPRAVRAAVALATKDSTVTGTMRATSHAWPPVRRLCLSRALAERDCR
eukprot:6194091-Pleurochrysis_carterae.AAC.4